MQMLSSITHLMSIQTCIRFFLMLNKQEDVLKNQTFVGPHCMEINTMEVSGDHQLFDYQDSYFMFSIRNKLTETIQIQIWNDMRVSQLYKIFTFD